MTTRISRITALGAIISISTLTMLTTPTIAPLAYSAEETTSAEAGGEYQVLDAGEGATVSIQQSVRSTDGTFEIKGSGWSGTGAGIVVKLNGALRESGLPRQFTRSGSEVRKHPTSGQDDATIWDVLQVGSDGSFDAKVDLPAGLEAGQHFSVVLTSGLTEGDTKRSVSSKTLTVDGETFQEDTTPKPTCVASSSAPDVEIVGLPADGKVTGRTLKVKGTGWCNTHEQGGSAYVAVKLDDGTVSRLDDSVHENRTIYQIIKPDNATGDFEVTITLPDGGTSLPDGTTPAFTEGEHSLRFLSGSLQDGDVQQTLGGSAVSSKTRFVVGEYKPNGLPEVILPKEDLTSDNQTVGVVRDGTELTLTIPDTQPGDWVYVDVYNSSGTATRPWGTTWYQVDDSGTVTLSLKDITLKAGDYDFVVQSGNYATKNALLGWAPVTLEEGYSDPIGSSSPDDGLSPIETFNTFATILGTLGTNILAIDTNIAKWNDLGTPHTSTTESTTQSTEAENPTTQTTPLTVARTASVTSSNNTGTTVQTDLKPTVTPDAPVDTITDLTEEDLGEITGEINDETLTLYIPSQEAGSWVFLYAYAPNPVPLGWVQLDKDKKVRLDTSNIPDGEHKIAVIGKDATSLLGWVGIALESNANNTAQAPAPAASTVTAVQPVATKQPLLRPIDWWMILAGVCIPILYGGIVYLVYRSRKKN